MADGGVEVPATNPEQEQTVEEQQHLENMQSAHHEQHGQEEQHEQDEQNGVTSDVPVPGTEPAAPTTPAPHSATLIHEYVKLFAGSIPKTFTEGEIKPLFDEYGEVLEIVLIKNKLTGSSQGCAFIKYKTVEEAEKAIAGLHNMKQLPGGNGPIQVRYADGERERLGNVENKLFVGNMNKTATEDEIREVFTPYGEIEDLYVMRGPDKVSRGCCFVKYSSRDAALGAIKTLNGAQTILNGEYPLAVRFADTKRRGEREDSRAGRETGFPGGRGPGSRAPPPQYGPPYAAPARGPPYAGRGYAPQAPYQPVPYAPPQQPPYYQPPVQQPQYAPPPQQYQPPPVAYAPAPPPGVPPAAASDWSEHTSPEGYKYYYNAKTGQSSWEKPEGFDGPAKEPVRSPAQYPPAAAPPPASDWTEHTSPEGLKYYYNAKTGQSSWEKPAEMTAPAAAQPQYAAPQYSAPAQQYAHPQPAAYQPPQQPAYAPSAAPPAGGKAAQYQHQNGPPGANLFIFRIPDDFDDDKLLQTFLPFGKVIHAKVGMDRDTGKSKGFGFVSYDNVESADAAIQALNGITIGGKRLKVEKKRGEDGSSATSYKPY